MLLSLERDCPSCGYRLKVPRKFAGLEGICGHCHDRVPARRRELGRFMMCSMAAAILILVVYPIMPLHIRPEQPDWARTISIWGKMLHPISNWMARADLAFAKTIGRPQGIWEIHGMSEEQVEAGRNRIIDVAPTQNFYESIKGEIPDKWDNNRKGLYVRSRYMAATADRFAAEKEQRGMTIPARGAASALDTIPYLLGMGMAAGVGIVAALPVAAVAPPLAPYVGAVVANVAYTLGEAPTKHAELMAPKTQLDAAGLPQTVEEGLPSAEAWKKAIPAASLKGMGPGLLSFLWLARRRRDERRQIGREDETSPNRVPS